MSQVTTVGLLLGADGVWVDESGDVPRFVLDPSAAGFWQDTARTCEVLSRQVGVPVTVLRHLTVERVGEDSLRVVELEAHGRAVGGWVDPGDIMLATGATAADLIDGAPVDRLPWQERGWYAEASAWISDWAGRSGVTIDRIAQLRSWNLSAIILAESNQGRVFFKSESPVLPGELAKTLALAARWPDVVPDVLAHDQGRRWMLLADAGARRLDAVTDPQVWETAGHLFGRMQVASSEHVHHLASLGLPIIDAPALLDDARGMVADRPLLQVGEYALSDARLARLESVVPVWSEALARLDALDVPLGVEHGDLHPGQFIVDESGHPTALDWSDASLSVPFISFDAMASTTLDFAEDQEAATRLLEAFGAAYRSEWESLVPAVRIAEALELIRGLRPMLRALPYWRFMPRMVQPWEMWNVVPYELRAALGR